MNKISVPKIFIGLGILLLLAGIGNIASAGGDTSFSFIGGVNFILGAIMYRSRKEHSKHKSNGWLIAETISLVVILFSVIPSIGNGLMYTHPLTFLIFPLIIFGCYFFAFHKYKKVNS